MSYNKLNSLEEELFIDFHLGDAPTYEVEGIVGECIGFCNGDRPCYSLGCKTPDAFYSEFAAGNIGCDDTFKDRVLDLTPKFIREKLAKAEGDAQGGVTGTSGEIASAGRVFDVCRNLALAPADEDAFPSRVSTSA